MSTTARQLAEIGNHLEESMGVRFHEARANLAPTPQHRDTSRRPLRNFGTVPVDQVIPDPDQPRTEFTADELARLAASIAEKGQLSPIRVRWSEDLDKWVIVFGERRWRAACLAGLPEISCQFQEADLTAGEILEQQLVENCLREDLKPVEEARAFSRLMEMKRWSGKQLAQALRLSESRVSRALALLRLPDAVQLKVDNGDLGRRTAYELSRLQNGQGELGERVVRTGMTVHQASRAVRSRLGRPSQPPRGTNQVFFADDWKVTVTSPKRGTYHDIEQALAIALEEVRHRINHGRDL